MADQKNSSLFFAWQEGAALRLVFLLLFRVSSSAGGSEKQGGVNPQTDFGATLDTKADTSGRSQKPVTRFILVKGLVNDLLNKGWVLNKSCKGLKSLCDA
jgi:hypothetical protein